MTGQAITLSLVLKLQGLAMNPMIVQVSAAWQSLVAQLDFVKAAVSIFA